MHTSALPPARAAKLYHSVLHMYYDVHLLSSLCFPHPSLIPSQLKISQVVRHVGVCPVPITLMTTTTISEIWEGRRRLRAQTPSSEPAFPPPHLLVHFKEQLSQDEKSHYHVSMVGLPFITANKGPGFTDNLYKPAAISYGRAILVIILVLYLALDGECWQCIVLSCNKT